MHVDVPKEFGYPFVIALLVSLVSLLYLVVATIVMVMKVPRIVAEENVKFAKAYIILSFDRGKERDRERREGERECPRACVFVCVCGHLVVCG